MVTATSCRLTPTICQIIEMLADGPSVQSSYPLVNAETSTCIVEASQPGDDRFAAAAPLQQTFKYKRASMVLTPVGPGTMTTKGPFSILVSTLFLEKARNSGLTSLGHVLTVTNTTPLVCSVTSHGTVDLTGGIKNKTVISGLTNGTCSLTYAFAGTLDRAPATATWSGKFSNLK